MQKNMETEQHFGPPPTEKPIHDWQTSKEEMIKKIRNTKCANRGLNAKWPKLDDIFKWIQGHHQNGIGINTKIIQIHARKLAELNRL